MMLCRLAGLGLILLCTAAMSANEQQPTTAASLTDIYNYHAIDEALATAGQVTPEQVALLDAAGFDLIVNLATASEERNASEGFAVTDAGLTYVHIPVPWDTPTMADLDLFFAVMDARGERKTLVHCFANYRASAFVYLYRTLRLGQGNEQATRDLEAIWAAEDWDEYPQWETFIEAARQRGAD